MQLKEWLPSELAQQIWLNKYQQNGETLEEWFNRIAGNNSVIKKLIQEKKFMPAGRILANRGLHKQGRKVTYSNCYVIKHPDDNIESIFETAQKLARTYSYGGGCGTDLSYLRPKGAKVNNAAKTTTGAVSFMELYNLTTGLIGQNGRRGALMLSMAINHPDIIDFIKSKADINALTKANISVRSFDSFMEAVKNNGDYELYFKIESTGEEIRRKVNAREILHMIAENAWNTGDPGFLYWDRITKWSLLSEDKNFEFDGTNPCGEEPLPAGGSCLLSAINLAELVKNPFTSNAYFDFEELKYITKEAVKYMNEILDEGLELHPLEEQRESVRNWRQIGIGLMGLADVFIKLGLKYGSKQSLEIAGEIGKTIINAALEQSALLAKEFEPYPMYNKKAILSSLFLTENATEEVFNLVKKYGLRNSQLLTIAPTGTISNMFEVSGGIEPIYDIAYIRKTESLHGEEKFYKIYTKIVDDYMKYRNIKEEELPEFITEATAKKLYWKDRINMQATLQNYIDASISSTVNLPNNATIEDIENIYLYGWQAGLKGITVFRDGCLKGGVLISKNEDKKEEPKDKDGVMISQDDYIGKKRKLTTGCGTLWCLAYFEPNTGDLRETFLNKGSKGGCNSFMIGLSRMISQAARKGLNVYRIADQLESCPPCISYVSRNVTKHDTSDGTSCPSAIARALIEMQEEVWNELKINKKEIKKDIEIPDLLKNSVSKNSCPECGMELNFENGCNNCKNCGWSQCS